MERRFIMDNLVYIPIEHIDQRYTIHLDNDIENYLNKNNISYIKVNTPKLNPKPLNGMFLDASSTIQTKSHQLKEIAKLYESGVITDSTTFFFSDLWFPGIESLAYLNYFFKVNPKITGIIHAGSFTDTDFVRDMERWAKNFEDIVFDISKKVFVASNFIKNDIIKKRIVNEDKIIVSGLPLDSSLDKYKTTVEKENIVIFNGRLCDEKQPDLFYKLKEYFKNENWTFISTQEQNYSKDKYYKLLAKSRCVVSFALQENFGYGINEAVELGCIPILPNRLVYPEIYSNEFLYNDFNECCNILKKAMSGELKKPKPIFKNCFKTWFV
jgi:glycosyltransferase involved in cell wall biosynthesis